ncbi:MAG TPA: ABC transporter permease, partial [Pilimelia sp.]|nr:ABC transporter permease [Pilimelia sp.]
GGLAAARSGLALVASTVLAVGGGVLLAAGGGGPVAPTTGVELTGLAVGAALLGGTSAFGRRGGVFGTLLAVVAVTLFLRYAEVSDWRIADVAVAAVLVAGGLGVTRLVERFGRPASGPRPLPVEWSTTDAEPPAPAWSTGRQEERQESWSSALPAQPTAGRADPWDADRWGGSRR